MNSNFAELDTCSCSLSCHSLTSKQKWQLWQTAVPLSHITSL